MDASGFVGRIADGRMEAVRIEMRIEAVTVGGRFLPNAFMRQVGGTIRVNVPGGSYDGRVTAAEVIEDGRAALLTVECDDAAAPLFRHRTLQDMSKGFSAPSDPALDEWMTKLPDVCSSMAGYYDAPESWQDLQADHDGVTPYHEGDDRG